MDGKQKELLQAFIDVIEKSSLLPNGYSLCNKEVEESVKVTEYTVYKITYQNKAVLREFIFSITDYYTHSRAFLSVQNIDGESHHVLGVMDYLQKFCDIENTQELNKLDTYEGDTIIKKLQSFLGWLRQVVDNRFFQILEGKDWEEIPFDWGPYK
jgi:hypothetical protein